MVVSSLRACLAMRSAQRKLPWHAKWPMRWSAAVILGWKRMGDLVVGDTVFDEAGCPTHVSAEFDALYHRTCYEVLFSDGSTLVADAQHQWVSYTCAERTWIGQRRERSALRANVVSSGPSGALQQLITASQAGNTHSASEAVALLRSQRWTVGEIARGMSH